MSGLLEQAVGRDRASVPELLLAQAERRGERPFLLWDGDEWTYAQALAEARAFAGALGELEAAGPGRRVAGYLPNRPEVFWAWFGTQLTGAQYVGLNPEQVGDLLADMLRRSGASVLVTDADGLERLPPPGTAGIERYLVLDAAGQPQRSAPGLVPYAPGPPWPEDAQVPGPAETASVIYTSGTTGRSKAVVICHNHLCRGGARFAESIELTERDRWHAWMPMCHIFGQLHVTMAALAAGASLSLWPTLSISRFWEQVEQTGCTVIGGLGHLMRMLWNAPSRDAHAENPVRIALIATPPLELRERFASHFGVHLVDSYGMTEAEPVTVPVPGREMPAGACGVENEDFEVAILDEQGGRREAGERGEIAIRPRAPDVMFRGYEGDEAATVAAWRDLWFHTGDWGAKDADGYLYLVDRRRDVIRRKGESVSPSEVEAAVRSHPAVADCAAVGIPSGDGEDEVKLSVVPEPESESPTPDEIHQHCRDRMARFMVPRYIEIVARLPYSELGKVDRRALRDQGATSWDAREQSPAGDGARV